jgi:Uma2 family endonuclease
MNVAIQKHRVTVSEWHKMGKYNIFPPNARMELIEGEIIDMAPIGPSHASCVRNLIELLSIQKGKAALLDVQNPILLSNSSEPEPDLTLLRPMAHIYRQRHPIPEEIFLLIEISESTIHYDRDQKIPLYAKEGIVECWLVDLNEFQVEVYQNPTANGYTSQQIFESGQVLIPKQLSHIKIPITEIFTP